MSLKEINEIELKSLFWSRDQHIDGNYYNYKIQYIY